MASANIAFDGIPASIRKPGKYFEFNTRLAVRTLPGNPQRLLCLAQKLASGSQPALVPVDIFSDEQAAQLFGRGSYAHRMARAAITANPYLQLTLLAVDDAPGSVAAVGGVLLAGTAASSGQIQVAVGNHSVSLGISAGMLASDIAIQLTTLLNALDLPVLASAVPLSSSSLPFNVPSQITSSGHSVVLTARHKGAQGNAIPVSTSCSASGITHLINAMAGGAIDPDYASALAAVAGAGHHIIAAPLPTRAHLTALRTHLDFVSGPLEQRGAVGVFGWPGTLATGTTLAGQINSGRITGAWHRGSVCLSCEIAAAYAAVLASEEDPARPLNTLPLAGLDVTSITAQPMRTEQENALANGLTPLEVGPGERVQIVRAITTYTKDPQGVNDVSLLDVTTIRTLDYVRKAVRERIALRFPREKLSERTPDKVRSEALDVLVKLEELEIVEAVEANKDGLLAERDSQDVNRLNLKIPCDVVNGLHVVAGRIDLLL